VGAIIVGGGRGGQDVREGVGWVVGGWCRVREWGGRGHWKWSGGHYCQVRERGVVVVAVRVG
jgi:hypothetical protein